MTLEQPILLTGAHGYLGHYLVEALNARGLRFETAGRRPDDDVELDLLDPDGIGSVFDGRIVLHAAAMASMGACRKDPEAARTANAVATERLAERAARLLFVSTDLVFSGRAAPYAAITAPDPISAYGRSKAEGEAAVLAHDGVQRHAVIRIPLLFGKSFDGRRGATDMLRASARAGQPLTLFDDEFRTPLHVSLAAAVCASLIDRRAACGVLHVAGNERLSRAELAERFLAVAEDAEPGPWETGEGGDPERPKDVSLVTDVDAQPDLDRMLAQS
jgi:dTDP-4-dehydrorhamnose reductase